MCSLPPLLKIREVNRRETQIGNEEIKESTNVFLKIYLFYLLYACSVYIKLYQNNCHSKTRHKLTLDTFLHQINKYSYNIALKTYYCMSQGHFCKFLHAYF